MKITAICKSTEWQMERMQEAASRSGVEFEIRDLSDPDVVPDGLGNIVLWRSSSLGGGTDRHKMMNAIRKDHILINRCLAVLPKAAEKAFQQDYVQEKTETIRCIPTFVFHSLQEIRDAIADGRLRFPFIQKPNRGSKGKGVELIGSDEDLERVALEVGKQVYQNYIGNTGDYRVLILGGKMLGAIKRTAKDDGFLNNISQGGSAEAVTDPKVLKRLRRIGTTVASIFELTLCGVDVIRDEASGEYFFLEVNTVPQWKGFQNATGIDVAEELIRHCQRIADRGRRPLPGLVSDEYRQQTHLLGGKTFHFLSRLSLWSGDAQAKSGLEDLKAGYIGNSEDDHRKRLKEIFTHIPIHGDRMASKSLRQPFFEKYPALEPSLGLLFKNLFAREIYGIDLRPYVRELITDEKLLELKHALEHDVDAMRILSTHAINFLYLLEEYLGTDQAEVDTDILLEIGTSYPEKSFELQIYFLTHCIIGASRFYSTNIKDADATSYTTMLTFIDELIRDHFQTISLDNKFEFLVCARICGYSPSTELEILSEAERSLAPDGNFLIDMHNAKASLHERNDFIGSEHRNVLFIMSQTPSRLFGNPRKG